MSNKLHLKETPTERENRLRKEEKRARKKQKRGQPELGFVFDESEERHWRLSEPEIHRIPGDIEASYNLAGSSSNNAPSYAEYKRIEKELEEAKFRAKLFDAMDDDEHLDSIQARFNAYHVPERWQDTRQANVTENPDQMDDTEYAEWIRRGMWEKMHQREMEEKRRKEHEAEERRAREKAQRRETRRLEEEARAKRRKQEHTGVRDAFTAYQASWDQLASLGTSRSLTYTDIPWPVLRNASPDVDVTLESISQFLLSEHHSVDKSKRRRIRDALFIYHPDRFEKWFLWSTMPIENESARLLERWSGFSIFWPINILVTTT